MKWSLRLGSLFGIRIYLHWTFLILIGLIVFASQASGQPLSAAFTSVAYVAAVFGCIVLHELGHALTARRYGIPTRDITLLPIGGVARLQRMPEKPLEELVVAVAGPAVNVVIALVLAVLLAATGRLSGPYWPPSSDSFLLNLMSINIVLVLFNLLPAFPMDGGRMLRALLATRMPYTQATHIAAGIGQFMAITFAIYGLFVVHNPFLLFIALFVYLGADAEAKLAEIRVLLRDVPVREAMMTKFRTLSVDDPLQKAADELLAGTQQDFPVMENGRFRGILVRDVLLRGLREAGPDVPVGTMIDSPCRFVSERDLLERVMEQMRESGCTTMPVLRGEELIGLVSLENVGELMMIRSALQQEPIVEEQFAQRNA